MVDNGSTDDSLAYLSEHWPEVEVLALPAQPRLRCGGEPGDRGRRGRAGGAAQQRHGARARSGSRPSSPSSTATEGPASATSKLLDFHDRGVLDGTGDTLAWTGNANRRGQGDPDTGAYDAEREVFSPCAGAALYRRAVFDDVGLFDEDFFAYVEDVDWGFRARLRGWGCRYVPESVAYHVGAATTRRTTDLEVYLNRRNQIALVVKNFPASALARYGWLVAVEQLHALWLAYRTKTVRRQLRAWRDAARQLPRTLAKRREIQRRRQVGVAELRPLLMPWRTSVASLMPGQERRRVRG